MVMGFKNGSRLALGSEKGDWPRTAQDRGCCWALKSENGALSTRRLGRPLLNASVLACLLLMALSLTAGPSLMPVSSGLGSGKLCIILQATPALPLLSPPPPPPLTLRALVAVGDSAVADPVPPSARCADDGCADDGNGCADDGDGLSIERQPPERGAAVGAHHGLLLACY